MNKFTNPLNKIRVASPCSADWNQMYGSERKRFCADCRLNVYNLSDMSRDEAENFLMASEGRVCVRFFRRADGTVLTRDCPLGWRALKQRVSKVAVGAFSVVIGIFCGLFSVRAVDSAVSVLPTGDVPPVELPVEPLWKEPEPILEMGEVASPDVVNGVVDLSEFRRAAAGKRRASIVVVGDYDTSMR